MMYTYYYSKSDLTRHTMPAGCSLVKGSHETAVSSVIRRLKNDHVTVVIMFFFFFFFFFFFVFFFFCILKMKCLDLSKLRFSFFKAFF